MKIHKKLLLVLCCSFANNFPLFAENEENYTDSNYSIESEDDNEYESSWLDEYPTYAKLSLGGGWGSKFNYISKYEAAGVVADNPYDYTKGTSFKKIGFEIGKVIGPWNLGFEASYLDGKIKKFTNYNEDLSGNIKMGTFMGNAYYVFPIEDTPASLVLGAGLGFDYLSLTPKCGTSDTYGVTVHDHSAFSLAGQLYIGLECSLTKDLCAILGYKFHKVFSSIDWTSANVKRPHEYNTNSEWKSPKIHLIEASIMYTF